MKQDLIFKVSIAGTPYVTIEGHTSSQPQQGYTPVPAPGQPSSS